MNPRKLFEILFKMLKQGDSLISISGVLANKVTQVLLQLIIVRLLTPADYSNFFFYYSSITGLSVFIGDGLGVSVSRFLSTAKEKSDVLIFNAVVTGLVTTVIPAVFLANQVWLHPEGQLTAGTTLTVILLAMMLSLSSILQYICVSIGLKRFLGISQVILAVITLIGASASAYLLNWQVVLSTLFFVMFMSNFVLIIKLIRTKIGPLPAVNWPTVYDLFKKALPICGAMALGAPVHVYCLSVLKKATHFNSPAEVGIFGISFVFYTLVSFLPSALGQFLVPWLLAHNEGVGVEKAYVTVCKLYAAVGAALLVAILVVLKVGVTQLIPSLIGREPTILLLAFTGFVAGFIALTSFYLNAVFKSRLVFISSIFHSTLYVILTNLLVSYMDLGATGLATAILISSTSQLIFLLFKINLPVFLKHLRTPHGNL